MGLHHHADRKYNAKSVAGGHELPINLSLYRMIIDAALHVVMLPLCKD